MFVKLLVLFILIILNAVFSAAEMAFVSLNKIELNEAVNGGSKVAKKIQKLLKDSNGFLATIQIGITFAGFLASAFAADTFADVLVDKIIPYVSISENILENIVMVITTILLSYISLVFSELVPKRIALSNPEKVASLSVDFILICRYLFFPIVWLLKSSVKIICKVLHINEDIEEKITEKEILSLIALGNAEGIIDKEENELLLNVFKFDDKKAEDIMIIREKMIAVDCYTSEKALIHQIIENKYSRIPVYKDKMDDMIGMIVAKDILMEYGKGNKIDLKKIIRPVKIIDAKDYLDDIFKEMQEEKVSLAIVKENGRTMGMITMEDLIEEILGNISDEFI